MNRSMFFSLLESGYEIRDSSKLMEGRGVMDEHPNQPHYPMMNVKQDARARVRQAGAAVSSRFNQAKHVLSTSKGRKIAGGAAAGLAGVGLAARHVMKKAAKPNRMGQLKNILKAHGGKAAAGAAAGAVGLHLLRRKSKKR